MFFLSLIEHKFSLPPELLPTKAEEEERHKQNEEDTKKRVRFKPQVHPLEKGVRKVLENNFLDKVIAKLGLCISIYDIRSISGGDVAPAAGGPTYSVKFRMVVFRPFEGEVISANLIDSTEDGLRLSLGFFDDIYIAVHRLPEPSVKETDSELLKSCKYKVLWRWNFKEDEDDEESEPLPMHIFGDCEIKFRVETVSFPRPPTEPTGKPFAPMVVTGTIEDAGLGPVNWW